MDRKGFLQKFKDVKGPSQGALFKVSLGLGAVILLAVLMIFKPHQKFLKSHHLTWDDLVHTYGEAFASIQHKVEKLRKAEQDNEKLKLENAHLRLMVESLQFDCHTDAGQRLTKNLESKLDHETGSRLGRTLASINYKLPVHLSPAQLHTLGVSYFKGREDEKSAVIFTFLTSLEDDNTYKTAKNFLIAGVSWYRLDNLDLADSYFDKALKASESADSRVYQGQARLWKGLVSERQGKHKQAQHWLREVLDHNPKSQEAAWINSGGVVRDLAAED